MSKCQSIIKGKPCPFLHNKKCMVKKRDQTWAKVNKSREYIEHVKPFVKDGCGDHRFK